MSKTVLVRYGAIGEVAKFGDGGVAALERGERVVVQSVRGVEIGTLLDPTSGSNGDGGTTIVWADQGAVIFGAFPELPGSGSRAAEAKTFPPLYSSYLASHHPNHQAVYLWGSGIRLHILPVSFQSA